MLLIRGPENETRIALKVVLVLLGPADLASLVTLLLGFLTVVTRAYALHMDIRCGCFAEPINTNKIFEDGAMLLAALMTVFAFIEARKPHPQSAPEKAAA